MNAREFNCKEKATKQQAINKEKHSHSQRPFDLRERYPKHTGLKFDSLEDKTETGGESDNIAKWGNVYLEEARQLNRLEIKRENLPDKDCRQNQIYSAEETTKKLRGSNSTPVSTVRIEKI